MSNKNLYQNIVVNAGTVTEEEKINTTIIEEFAKLNEKCDSVIVKIKKRKARKSAV